ncbi:MAG: hypothetical protein JO122_13460 [Acetobacteraceae bacterium]|nr:hypothetical protein [Acetobacteraceae bacterium]
MADTNNGSGRSVSHGVQAVIDLFLRDCETFMRALAGADNVADEVDFTGSLHELAIDAGRVQALGEALSLFTANPEWKRQADDVVSDYLTATALVDNEC